MSDTRTQTYEIAPCRMPPLEPDAMTAAQREVAAEIAAGPRGGVMGPYIAILRSPGLARHAQKLGAYYRFECALDLRIRELAALMTARWWQQQFEFHVHVPHALGAGLARATIDAVIEGRRPQDMPEDESVCWEFVHELQTNKSVTDPTYARAVARFGEEGVVDIIGVCGYYAMIAMVMNVARTEIPDGAALALAPLEDHVRRTG